MRKTVFCGLTLLILIFSAASHSQAATGLIQNKNLPRDNVQYYNFDTTINETVVSNVTVDYLDIVNIKYEADLETNTIVFEMDFASRPILNASMWYQIDMEFLNSTAGANFRVGFSNRGDPNNTGGFLGNAGPNETLVEFVYRPFDGSDPVDNRDQTYQNVTRDRNALVWVVSTDGLVSLESIFAGNMEREDFQGVAFQHLRTEGFEQFDYYEDSFDITEIPPYVPPQNTNEVTEGLWDIIDPIALTVFFAIPLAFIIYRVIRNFRSIE